jgi:phosphopantothenoylcysteine decarboxylase/phosphopantothenate--cysteine ligase
MSGVLNLVRNPDILAGVTGAHKIGFAAETDNVLAEAVRKCRDKGLEMIVANDVTAAGAGFGCDTNRVTFVTKDGIVEQLPLKSKLSIARRIVRFAERLPPA